MPIGSQGLEIHRDALKDLDGLIFRSDRHEVITSRMESIDGLQDAVDMDHKDSPRQCASKGHVCPPDARYGPKITRI